MVGFSNCLALERIPTDLAIFFRNVSNMSFPIKGVIYYYPQEFCMLDHFNFFPPNANINIVILFPVVMPENHDMCLLQVERKSISLQPVDQGRNFTIDGFFEII